MSPADITKKYDGDVRLVLEFVPASLNYHEFEAIGRHRSSKTSVTDSILPNTDIGAEIVEVDDDVESPFSGTVLPPISIFCKLEPVTKIFEF